MKSGRFLTLASLALLAAGCSSADKKLSGLGLNQIHSTGIIFPVQLITDDPVIKKQGCTFKIQNQESEESFEFTIQYDKIFEVVSVPPGTYRIENIHCTTHLRWLLTQGWPKFHVYSDEISVFAPHLLYAGKDGEPSKFRVSKKKTSMATLSTLIKKLDSPMKDHLVSAYLGTLIPPEIVDTELKNDEVILESNPSKKFSNWHPKFQPCFDNERASNELFAGVFAMSAIYENHSAFSVQISPLPNTYSVKFKQCVVNAAKAYHPESPEKFLASYYF